MGTTERYARHIALKEIGEDAFIGCQLTDIKMPANLQIIGEAAFTNISTLKTVDLSSTKITEIKRLTFQHCENLETVIFPEGLLSIGEDAFQDCAKLAHIDIPDNVIAYGNPCRVVRENK